MKKKTYTFKHMFPIIIIICIGVFAISGMYFLSFKANTSKNVGVRHDLVLATPFSRFSVQVVKTDKERAEGLSFKESITGKEGMLFVFDEEGKYGFWMKEMNFGIDIIWINEKGVVVHTEEGVSPESFPTVFINEVPAKYVLEVNKGKAKEAGVFLGTQLFLPELLQK